MVIDWLAAALGIVKLNPDYPGQTNQTNQTNYQTNDCCLWWLSYLNVTEYVTDMYVSMYAPWVGNPVGQAKGLGPNTTKCYQLNDLVEKSVHFSPIHLGA